jgi:signal transduction histidine kinase
LSPDLRKVSVSLERAELAARLRWFIQLRWVFGAVTLLTGLALSGLPLVQVRAALVAAVGAGILAYNWGFWLWERRASRPDGDADVERAPLAAGAQIILDLVALTLVLHAAGGIENPFFTFYLFHMVIATLLLSMREVFALAVLAILLFSGLAITEMNGWLAHASLFRHDARHQDPEYVVVTLLAFASALLIAVYLGTSIAGTLRSREREVLRLERELAERARQLEQTNEVLRHADTEKTQYFRKVSHDLKTPLAAQISLLRSLLIELHDLPPASRSRIERAIRRGDELFALLNDLLMLSRARDESRRRRRGFEWVDPVEALRAVLEQQALHAEEKGVRWELQIGDPVPTLCAEPGVLPTLVENVVSNAIKYTPGGGLVTFSLYGRSDWLVVEVQDTGIGIESKDLERIGQEFFRTRRALQSGESGTGLGMTIVRSIVDNMHGKLDIESRPGAGTTVTVSLPVAGSPEVLSECGRSVSSQRETEDIDGD